MAKVHCQKCAAEVAAPMVAIPRKQLETLAARADAFDHKENERLRARIVELEAKVAALGPKERPAETFIPASSLVVATVEPEAKPAPITSPRKPPPMPTGV